MNNDSIDPKNCCRVCGRDHKAPPWGEDGRGPEYWICPCCGVEAGYGDETRDDAVFYRKYWLGKQEAKWWQPKKKPDNWSLEDQLKQIPREFRD